MLAVAFTGISEVTLLREMGQGFLGKYGESGYFEVSLNQHNYTYQVVMKQKQLPSFNFSYTPLCFSPT